MVESLDNDHFYEACIGGKLEDVEKFFTEDLFEVNVNYREYSGWGGWTPLHRACLHGHLEVVSFLLRQPTIDVNARNYQGWTPLFVACASSCPEITRALLEDPRTDLLAEDSYSMTALHYAVVKKKLKNIQCWLFFRGKDLPADYPKGMLKLVDKLLKLSGNKDALAIADYIKFYGNNRKRENLLLREQFLHSLSRAADLFSLVLFNCDGFLSVRNQYQGHRTGRFFIMAEKLPQELQVILCNRVIGIPDTTISSTHTEPAFRKLAQGIK